MRRPAGVAFAAALTTAAMIAPALPAASAEIPCAEWICSEQLQHGRDVVKQGVMFSHSNPEDAWGMPRQDVTYIGSKLSIRVDRPEVRGHDVVWTGGVTDRLATGDSFVIDDRTAIYHEPVTAHVTVELADGSTDYVSFQYEFADIEEPIATIQWSVPPVAGSTAKVRAILNPRLAARDWDEEAGSWLEINGVGLPVNEKQNWSEREFAIPGNAAGKAYAAGAVEHAQSTYGDVPGYRFVRATLTGTIGGGNKYGKLAVDAPNNVLLKFASWGPTAVGAHVTWYRDGVVFDTMALETTDYEPYIPQSSRHVGHAFRAAVKVKYVDGSFSPEFTTAAVKMPAIQTVSPRLAVSGVGTYGKTLSAKPVVIDRALSKRTYQWYRNGAAIKGATRATYKLGVADVGKKITVRLTASATGYMTKTASQIAAAKVAPAKLIPKSVHLKGAARPGNVLRVHTASWGSGVKYAYRWYRDGKPIKDAMRSGYKLTTADAKKRISARVIGSKPGYTQAGRGTLRVLVAAR